MVICVPKQATPVQADRIIAEVLQHESRLTAGPSRQFTIPTLAKLRRGTFTKPPNPRFEQVCLTFNRTLFIN